MASSLAVAGSATNDTSPEANPFRTLLKIAVSDALELRVDDIGSVSSQLNSCCPHTTQQNTAINPQFPPWALAILLLFAILRGILILICITIMVIPLIKGPASRKKHLCLFRRIYAQPGESSTENRPLTETDFDIHPDLSWAESGIPYVVPSRSYFIAVCELCSSVLYLFAACENYTTYRHSGLRKADTGWYLTLWYGLASPLLTSVQFYIAKPSDGFRVKNSRLPQIFTPTVYNIAWVSWLTITIASMAYWAIRMARELSQSQIICLNVVSALEEAVISWDTRGTTHTALINILHDQSLLARRVQEIVQLLLRMLEHVLRKRDVDSMAVGSEWSSPIWQELEDEFIPSNLLGFLCKSSILVTLSIVSQVSELVYQTHSARELTQLNWRIGSALITHLPGIFMTPALLVQSWRILTERSDESKYQKASLSVDKKNIPKMTSQLLGWDTTVFWGKENEFELGNFPGLCPVESSHSTIREVEENPNKTTTLHIPFGDLSVMRSTVVTHEEIQNSTLRQIQNCPYE
ncbi:uncharacterized protein MELLADRAFT_59505 [Melampsora larici-populina 98AG31]|uniref:Uncharacterized protein n=1 Tax=Melampsora larici-populina (strain 98AG31 / pathotype 3-4-7) TaxID=747676 RepID=F4R7R0_MELLP|nr:uncharacterized protein MELLADRAFT_59505 [Melampsora larici-populina 98AG31]EGG11355.1 hypothetical protein MELLADRAFT_59505 [Melampsora larici-populina 98AG31]